MSEWRKVRIDEIAEKITIGPFGSRMKSDTYTETGVPVIRGTNITGGRSFSGNWVFVSEKDADQLANCNVTEGDLVFPHRGAIGEVGIVPGDRERYLLSTSLMKLRCNSSEADSLFLFYFFKSYEGRHQLLKNASQVGTPGIGQPLSSLKSIELGLPPLDTQRAIAHILGTLDDKIELNRRTNETLEAMARAIFKSWFVGFDSVRVSASDFIREKVLEIGDGYRAKNDELGDEGLPFIRAMNLKNGFDTVGADRLRPDRVAGAESKCSRLGDVAFTSKGTIGRIARVGEATDPFVYSPQVCFWRTLDPERMHPAILYCWMQSDDFLTQLHGRSGQSDMAPYVSLRDQRAMFMPRFDASQAEVGQQITPLLNLVSENQVQSHTLRILRDTLLPRLLSGEMKIDVPVREMDGAAAC